MLCNRREVDVLSMLDGPLGRQELPAGIERFDRRRLDCKGLEKLGRKPRASPIKGVDGLRGHTTT